MRAWIGVAVLAVVAVLGLSLGFQTVRAVEHPGRAEHPQEAQKAETPPMFQCPMHPEVRATWEATCPRCGTKLTRIKKAAAPEGGEAMAGMMGMMGDMRGMMMRCRMMMGAHIQKTDPVGLLSLTEELGLSEEQVGRLRQIAQRARQDAEAVLTDEQKEKLEAMPDEPQSMMQMHRHMQQMMKGHMMGKPGPEEEQEHEGHGMHHGGTQGMGRMHGGSEEH